MIRSYGGADRGGDDAEESAIGPLPYYPHAVSAPEGTRNSQQEEHMNPEQRIPGVGATVGKLEDQLRTLKDDLRRLTQALESEDSRLESALALRVDDSRAPATSIEADSAIEGVYITSGNLQVDGLLKGEVLCQGSLFISERGVVQAIVEASEIVLAGRLAGEVHCDGSFVVLPTGWVSGKVTAASVIIHDGAYYAGELELRNERSQESSTRSTDLMEQLERRKAGRLTLGDLSRSLDDSSGGLAPAAIAWPQAEGAAGVDLSDGDTAQEPIRSPWSPIAHESTPEATAQEVGLLR